MGWGQTVRVFKSTLRCLDMCCGPRQLSWAGRFLHLGFHALLSFPGALPLWSSGTSEHHVRIRVIKKKKIIMKKRKKLTHPRPPVTAGPSVTTSPAGTLDLPEKQEPGTSAPGALPGLAVSGGTY